MKTGSGMRRVASIFTVVLFALSLAVFGWGGGGGDGPVGATGIAYTGVTSQTTITGANAQTLSTGAYSGGATGSTLGVGAVVVLPSGVTDRPRYLYLAQSLEEVIGQVDVTAPPGVVKGGAILQKSDSVPGDCGGSAAYVISFDDVTGDFSGTINFSGYCSEGVTLSGNASFSGRIDLSTRDFLEFSFSFDDLSGTTAGGDSITIRGNISFDYQTSPATATMDLLLRDNSTAKVYWANNYSMTTEDMGGYVEFIVSGRYYDPDYGWVTVTTATTFQITVGQEWPYQGSLVLDGSGSTKAQLTALTSATYEVEADTDGNGTYDWNSLTLNWP